MDDNLPVLLGDLSKSLCIVQCLHKQLLRNGWIKFANVKSDKCVPTFFRDHFIPSNDVASASQ